MAKNLPLVLEVGKCLEKRGYSIFHNQPHGWKGAISDWFGWYKYKGDAEKEVDRLRTYYKNNPDKI